MATLSVSELAKRNNFSIFVSRIRNAKEFKLNDGNGASVKLNKNLLKELTPYSLTNIGEILAGRDHTTIIHHISCKSQKNGLWFPYFEIWNSFNKLKLDLESDFKIVK